jgi:hypothetical protein
VNHAAKIELQRRIDHLESLVCSLAPKQHDGSKAVSSISTESAVSDGHQSLANNSGHIKVQKGTPSYTDSEHWTAILDEIHDFRSALSEHEDTHHLEIQQEPRMLPCADLFSYPPLLVTQIDILSAIPSRSTVDSLVARYFSSADMPVSLIIHREEFFNQYENFWENSSDTPIMWIAVLLGMLFIAAYEALVIAGASSALDEVTLLEYRNIIATSYERIIQCLRLGNYMRGGPNAIEALLFLLQLEFVQGEDRQHECWQLTGVTVRIALKMGYHRDGSHFPQISAYEAEMRRRIWYILIQFDTASAAQVGLPRMIRETQYDTMEPHNLLDTDFNTSTRVLPSSRPQTEHTLSQFLVSKSKVVSVYGMICDFNNSSQQCDYTEAIRLDALLNDVYSQKPASLTPKSMSRSITDGTALITRRLYIAMSFHHAQISLHRKFMLRAKTDSRYTYSHTACLDAASAALRYQSEMFEHSLPGRMLYAERWKILSLIQSEFLLATTVLCANLNDDLEHKRWETTSLCSRDLLAERLSALATSRVVWEAQQEFSREAKTAVKAITVVLAKAARAEKSYHRGVPWHETPSGERLLTALPASIANDSISSHLGRNTSSAGDVNDSMPGSSTTSSAHGAVFEHRDSEHIAFLGTPTSYDDEVWSSIFDVDQSWDTWIQR